jgi:hypothetical protein
VGLSVLEEGLPEWVWSDDKFGMIELQLQVASGWAEGARDTPPSDGTLQLLPS